MYFSRGMRDRLDKYIDISRRVTIKMETTGPAVYDYCCFGVDRDQKLSDDRYMIFYNQKSSPEGAVIIEQSGNNAVFSIELSRLPSFIDKLVFTVTVEGGGMIREMSGHSFTVLQDNFPKISFDLKGSDFKFEKAVISAELYRKDVWRFYAAAAGFNGGLSALLKSFGGTEQSKAPSASENALPFYLQNNQAVVTERKNVSPQNELPFYLRNNNSQRVDSSNVQQRSVRNMSENKPESNSQDNLPFYLRNSTPQQEMKSNKPKAAVQQSTSTNTASDTQDNLPFYLRNSTPQQEMKPKKENTQKPVVSSPASVQSAPTAQPTYGQSAPTSQPTYGQSAPTVQPTYGQSAPTTQPTSGQNDSKVSISSARLKKTEEELTNEVMGKISLSKDREKLGQHVVSLSKCMVSLSKNTKIDLGNMRAKVVVAFDYSGSMSHLYKNGTVQNTLNRLVPLGLTFDDNGTIDVFLFQDDYRKITDLDLSNYENYVNSVIATSGYSMGGTNYAPVLRAIITGDSVSYGGFFGFGAKSYSTAPIVDDNDPTFVLFITDGENFDRQQTDDIIRRSSSMNVFIQFIGIGYSSFKYLQKLDDMEGRVRDNTGFSKMVDLDGASDKELYTNVLEQFSLWLNNMQ